MKRLFVSFIFVFTAIMAMAQIEHIKVGVMLPLHDINGDGKRMVEYYRGLLMACDSLKAEGITTDVYAWNVEEGQDIAPLLLEPDARRCDVIFGPLYSTQVKALADFCKTNGQKMVIPFSILSPMVNQNEQIMQVYQTPAKLNDDYIAEYIRRFSGYHTIFVDCNDTTSKKGSFTFTLRKKMEERGLTYNITNLKSSEQMFLKAFSQTKPNMVILNTGRSQELNVAFAKLNNIVSTTPGLIVSMFGYTEWLMYTKYNIDNFHRFNVYVPSTFYYDATSPRTKRIELKYRWNFHQDMQQALPRFAITGFDQGYYILKGISQYGRSFSGAPGLVGYKPIQTPLRFHRTNNMGGYQNEAHMIVNFGRDGKVQTIEF